MYNKLQVCELERYVFNEYNIYKPCFHNLSWNEWLIKINTVTNIFVLTAIKTGWNMGYV